MRKYLKPIDYLILSANTTTFLVLAVLGGVLFASLWGILTVNNFMLVLLLRKEGYLEKGYDFSYVPTDKGFKFFNDTIFLPIEKVFMRFRRNLG